MDLRPYQRADSSAILACLQRRKNPLYVLPTGGGKTVVAGHVLSMVTSPGLRWRVLWLVHRQELGAQASRALHAVGIDHGLIVSGQAFARQSVAIASIDTLPRRADTLRDWLAGVRVVVVDEAHHVAADKWGRVLALCPQARFFGLTATPYRLDGQGLGAAFDTEVRGPSIRALINDGYLVEPQVYAPRTGINLTGLRKRFGDWAAQDLVARMDTPALTRMALRWYAHRMPGVPTVVFCASVDHARHVCEAFEAAGWVTGIVHGGTPPDARAVLFTRLAAGEIQVVCNVEIITEGVDVPRVGGVILLRPTASPSLYLQMVGRALRPSPGKTGAPLVDLAGVSALHGLPDEDRPWSLHGGLGRYAERAVAALRVCPACARVTRRADYPQACPCGRPWPSDVAVRASERLPLGGGRAPGSNPVPDTLLAGLPPVGRLSARQARDLPLKDVLGHVRTRLDLQTIARLRGYRAGWVEHVARELGVGRIA